MALEQALSQPRQSGVHARHVLIVTDAEVTDAGRILRLADTEAHQPDRRRISVLCIDSAPNAQLAQELAERSGGVARFLTSAPQEEDITSALDEVLRDWAAPVAIKLRLAVNQALLESTGKSICAQPEGSAVDLGDLPAGRPAWVVGRVPHSGALPAFRLSAEGNPELATAQPPAEQHPALKALFGARRLNGLEYLVHASYPPQELADALRRLGYDPAQALTGGTEHAKVYAENVRADTERALRQLLVRESLDYGLPCSETAFIAVRSEQGKPVEEFTVIGNALPAGWSDEFLTQGPIAQASMLGGATRAYSASPPTQNKNRSKGLLGKFVDFVSESTPQASFVSEPAAEPAQAGSAVIFSGTPQFSAGEAVLFDSRQQPDSLPEALTLTQLAVRFPAGAPDIQSLDPSLTILIYVDDLASPRARVRLTDLLRQGGLRPLNLTRSPGQLVRLLLADPTGAWAHNAPPLEVALEW